jgi:hypothetical protein
MGTVNSSFTVVDSNPVLHLTNGSPCPNAGDTKMLANTAIRFICDPTIFGSGECTAQQGDKRILANRFPHRRAAAYCSISVG